MIWLGSVLSAAAADGKVVIDLNDKQAEQLGIDAQAAANQLGDAISNEFGLVDASQYLASFANADAIALKGMGVDYASNPKIFSVGGSLGSGVSDVPLTFVRDPSALPQGGYAFMASIYAGLNLGVLTPGDDALSRFRLYVNGLAFRPPGSNSFQGSMHNYGAHLQVKLINPISVKAVEWGGFDLTAGYERSYYVLELTKSLPLSQAADGAKFTWTATGDYTLSSTAGTVPLELSTNFRVLVLTVYGGAGVDFDAATSTTAASLSGPVDVTVSGKHANLGTASVTIQDEGSADPFAVRLFVGAQANVLALKLFGQLNVGANDTYGGFVGVRLAR